MEFEGLDFPNVENTINEIGRRGETLSERLFAAVSNQCNATIAVKVAEGKCETDFRRSMANAGVKVTDGGVAAVVNADPEVVAFRRRLADADAALAKTRADLDSLRDIRRMFCGWQAMQTKGDLS